MPSRYYYPQPDASVANPSLSAGLFSDPSQLHVSAANLSNAGQYGIAMTTPYQGQARGPGWNGGTWSNDYQFTDTPSLDSTRQAALMQALGQRNGGGGGGGGGSPIALTDSLADNRILGGIQNPQSLGLMLQRRTDAQMNPQAGYGIIGNNVAIDGQSIPIPSGVDPDAFAQQQQSRVSAARAAATGARSKFDIFASQPEIRDLGAPAQQALYESRYGAKPDPAKQIDGINRQLDAYTKAYGVNPIAAVNHMEATGAQPGFVISMPGKFDKGPTGDAKGTYVPGPNVHLTPGLIEIGRKMRKAQGDALGISGDLSSSPYPFGYDQTQPSTDTNQIVQPRSLLSPARTTTLLRSAVTTPPVQAPSTSQEVTVFKGKRYLVDHSTRSVTPIDQ